jgi:hypothetical protein
MRTPHTLLCAAPQAWAALPPDVRADKESFYRGQQRTASGFMSLARTTLRLLLTLTADDAVVSVLCLLFAVIIELCWRHFCDLLLLLLLWLEASVSPPPHTHTHTRARAHHH